MPRLTILVAYAETLAARGLAIAGQVGVAVITARALGPEDRGRYFYIVTLGALAAQLGMLGLQASNGYLVARDRNLLPAIITNTLWIIFVGGLGASALIITADHLLAGGKADANSLYVPWLCLATLAFSCFSNLAVACDRPRLYNILIAANAAALLGAVGIGAGIEKTVPTFLLVTLCALIGMAIVSLAALVGSGPLDWRFNTAIFRRGLTMALKAHFASLAAFLFSRLGIIILRGHGDFDDVGHWSVAVQITDALLVVPGTIGILLYPRWARASDQERWRGLTNALLAVGSLMLLACAVAAVLAGPVIGILFGAPFSPAALLTLTLLPSTFFLSLTSMMSNFLTTYGVPKAQMAGWAMACAAFALGSLLVAPDFGAFGVGCVQSVVTFLLCLWMVGICVARSPGRSTMRKEPNS
jgi:O-antigen/teichoic acid export membrane protein